MVISIVTIGHSLDPDKIPLHNEIVKKVGYVTPELGIDGSKHIMKYSLTHLGQPIEMTEYAT